MTSHTQGGRARLSPSSPASLTLALALLAWSVAARPAAAQGYGVYEQGACTMARAGAAAASPCRDGSAVFFNPAAVADTGRPVASIGGTLIAPQVEFTDARTGTRGELADNAYVVPAVYYVRPVGDRLGVGLGLFAPYGLTTEWPATFAGRFQGYKSVIRGIYLQPSAAVRLHRRVSVGAGFDLSFFHVQLRQRLDLSEQVAAPGITFANLGVAAGTDFADVNLHGNSTGVGYHLGLLVRPVDRVSIGARYLSRQLVKFDDGSVDITQVPTNTALPAGNPLGLPPGASLDAVVAPQFAAGGPLTDQRARTYLRIPEQLVLGVAAEVLPALTLLFDYQNTNWSVFEELPITFERLGLVTRQERFRRTHGFRIGGQYRVAPRTALRAGWYTHGAAAPAETVTPNLPEAARTSFTLGFGTGLGEGLAVDLAYQYLDQADRLGRSGELPNNGLYTGHTHLVGATLALAF